MLSPSESLVQPLESTTAPDTVVGQRSMPLATPSLSVSEGQPRPSTWAPDGVPAQRSRLLRMPSPSLSSIGLLPSIRLMPRLKPKLEKLLELLLFRLSNPSPRIITVGLTAARAPAPSTSAPLPPQG